MGFVRGMAVAGAATLVCAALAGQAEAATAPSFMRADGCVEHQAFFDGDAAAVRTRLPRAYSPTLDPSSGRPLLFARAERCAVTIGARTETATMASAGIVVDSPDGRGCGSGAPGIRQTQGQNPPVCNWYPLFWVADQRPIVDWLRAGAGGFPAVLAPNLSFQAAPSGAGGTTSFSFQAPARFTMQDTGHPQSAPINVRGGYWSGSGSDTIKLAFSTNDLAPGFATGVVRAAPGSELARLMGAQQASYLPEFSAIGGEHWGHGSYRKQLLGPSARSDSFAGSCALQGTDTFTPPATNTAQDLHVVYNATGTCSGTLDGRAVTNAPVRWQTIAHSYGTCSQAQTVEPGAATLTFADGTAIHTTLDFTTDGTEVAMDVYGERSGFADGQGTFATQRTTPDVITGCAGAGDREVPMDLSIGTQSPLVSDRAAGPGGSQPHAAKPQVHLSVRPRTVRAGQSTLLSFVVSARGRPVRGVVVRFGHRRARTGRRGRAVIRVVLRRAGRIAAVATKSGYRNARASVTVERRRDVDFNG